MAIGIDSAARLAALRSRFIERTLEDRGRIGLLLKCIPAKPASDTRAELTALLHRLAGSASAFGFPTVAIEAARLEGVLRESDTSKPLDAQRLLKALDQIRH